MDTLGRALGWNGQSWIGPAPIDPGTGLTSVSCPSSTFCVAVDGDGDALTYNGTSWSAAHVDSTGSSLQSVSCASSTSFCAAGDWDGNVYTFNGDVLDARPRAIDAAGGGISSMSCPASDVLRRHRLERRPGQLERGQVDGQGERSTPTRAGGLMSLSCQSATWCMAVDGSGDYLTWNGVKPGPARS